MFKEMGSNQEFLCTFRKKKGRAASIDWITNYENKRRIPSVHTGYTEIIADVTGKWCNKYGAKKSLIAREGETIISKVYW